ncbi:MAG TPA: ATP-binding protein [Gemmatimonadales bacterium]|nr:ATP-binding protein [Gemmatimonadales bacterium]
MTTPPSTKPASQNDPTVSRDLDLVRRLTVFGQEVAGTLRRASVIDLLVRHVRESLTPSEIAVALFHHAETIDFVLGWPPGRSNPRPLLELASRRGPMLIRDNLETVLREAGLTSPPLTAGSWLIAPFVAKNRVTGAIAVRGEAGRYQPADLVLLEGLVSQASIALESARLVDLHDDGRRTWQEVVDAISPALCIVDRSGAIRRANRAFADLVNAPPASLIGRPWQAFVPPEWSADLQRALDQQGVGREVELRTGERTYAVTAVPISSTDHSAVVLLFDDQTERRRLQDQLIQSEKMSAIGQLIAGIAHDLNNPLASVVGFADFLTEVPNIPASIREPLAVVRDEAERASSIVRNLLGFARKQDHQRRPTALKPLLDATFVLLRNQLMAQRVEAQIDIEPDLPMPDVDPNQIQQVFVNLINNAAQAIASTGRPGNIMVRARRWLDGVAIDIIDDGPGMSEALAAQVFEPFFTTKAEGEGTGLGLSISQGIVKEHGGRIMLSSEEGRGSTFTVQLPLSTRASAPPPATGTRAPTRRLRVLVVDDEPHILHYMRATLEAWGHIPVVASDGEEALARATREQFDLIISDLRMPRLGGREFYERLVIQNPTMAARLVFSTGDTVRGDTLTFLEALDRPYLHKPFSLAELRTLLAEVERSSGEPASLPNSRALPADVLPGT